ncbi:MAG: hypothetical protein BGO37_06315 [Cellulomonas sp. 73-92]|uniref:SHOCT domain-containing protein n=1 Tax=Cellulomonas sp. 73-92 TaxID=1895740 RepID=UPI00092620E2|nr:SHOCT domain-containing protein [Cellulomonas sp. 73-92]OJV81546.1 MAG: hypothetical protein BGO37_06315 [Cellulomonas sp. 73-92]
MTVWQVFWLMVEAFFFVAYLVILFQIVGDLFRDRQLSGGGKALWLLLLLVLPWLGALIYLVARGRGMTQRAQATFAERRAEADEYIRTTAGTSPAQEIAAAQQLLSSGAITPDEFARLKAKALATV